MPRLPLTMIDTIRALIGCDWGALVWSNTDPDRCQEQAVRRTVLHHPDGSEILVQTCPRHTSAIREETTPR